MSFLPTPDGWNVSAVTAAGARRAVARRNGVTFVFVGAVDDGWEVTKLHGGKVLAERRLRHLPESWRKRICAPG